jgi:colanic acid/amylovoran biosynthesis glycosyltransferase
MRSHDIVLAPSVVDDRGDQEGIPNVLKEAMALGIPVVATRHSGIPDLIEDGVTGFLAEERDARGLAHAVHQWIKANQSARGRMIRRARRHVEEEFDSESLSEKLLSRFMSLSGRSA